MARPRKKKSYKRRGGSTFIILLLMISFCIGIATGRIEMMWKMAQRYTDETRPKCEVIRVIDGDTVSLHCRETGFERLRIMGYDSPEIFSPDCMEELVKGYKARWDLQRILWSSDKLFFVFRGRDRYDRRLGEIRVGGRSVSRQMIETSYARPYNGGRRERWC